MEPRRSFCCNGAARLLSSGCSPRCRCSERCGTTKPEGATASEFDQAALDAGELYLADHDHLTGLWNRRRFEEELDRLVARSRRDDERLALLSIDVDRYRDVIHRHGAGAAEGLIQSISHTLAKRLRPNKTLARMGGDEFAAVLPGATRIRCGASDGETYAYETHALPSLGEATRLAAPGVRVNKG